MSIISLQFAVFCALIILVYYLLPGKLRGYWLLLASYVFYGWREPRFLIFLLLSTLSVYFCARMMDDKPESARRPWLIICLILNIGILAVLKYTGFFLDTLRSLGLPLRSVSSLILPLGISFYTFQSLGYLLDVYRSTVKAEKNPARVALFVAFFPQIAEGPIGRYTELEPQLFAERKFDPYGFSCGLRRILWGCFKKMLLADRLGVFVDAVYADPSGWNGPVLILAAVMYAFQLYADFSGYMDIALGIAQCLGICLSENFDGPYFSRSIAEFWRRWHITLGGWFRDYVYYPVLRSDLCDRIREHFSRKGKKKLAGKLATALALACVWLLIGFWHGANWTYVVHGLLNGAFIISGTFLSTYYARLRGWLSIDEKKPIYKGFQMIRTFLLVCFCFIFFRSDSLSQASIFIRRVFCLAGDGSSKVISERFGAVDWTITLIAIALILISDALSRYRPISERAASWPRALRWGIDFFLIFSIIIFRASNSSSFIYFQF